MDKSHHKKGLGAFPEQRTNYLSFISRTNFRTKPHAGNLHACSGRGRMEPEEAQHISSNVRQAQDRDDEGQPNGTPMTEPTSGMQLENHVTRMDRSNKYKKGPSAFPEKRTKYFSFITTAIFRRAPNAGNSRTIRSYEQDENGRNIDNNHHLRHAQIKEEDSHTAQSNSVSMMSRNRKSIIDIQTGTETDTDSHVRTRSQGAPDYVGNEGPSNPVSISLEQAVPSGSEIGIDVASLEPMMERSGRDVNSSTGTAPHAHALQHSQPGAYRVDGPTPSQSDDIYDDRSLVVGAEEAMSEAAVVPGPGPPQPPEEQPQELPQITAYLVENNDEGSRQSSAELRERLDALALSVEELALSTTNNSDSTLTSAVMGGIPEGPIDPEGNDPELALGEASAITSSTRNHRTVPGTAGPSTTKPMSTSSQMDGTTSTTRTISSSSSDTSSLVEMLRYDQERRQKERVERAEQRARVRQQRLILERRRKRRMYLIYFVVAVVLGLALYFVLRMGYADNVVEKLEGRGGNSGETAATPSDGDGGSTATALNRNGTLTTTNSTTTKTISDGTLPGVLAGGLSAGIFLLMLGCGCTTKIKVSSSLEDGNFDEERGGLQV